MRGAGGKADDEELKLGLRGGNIVMLSDGRTLLFGARRVFRANSCPGCTYKKVLM